LGQASWGGPKSTAKKMEEQLLAAIQQKEHDKLLG
jgi:hypothetical protein